LSPFWTLFVFNINIGFHVFVTDIPDKDKDDTLTKPHQGTMGESWIQAGIVTQAHQVQIYDSDQTFWQGQRQRPLHEYFSR
jgi:hypothetical protein